MDNLDVYYRTVGVQPGTSLQQVKRAYRDLVKVWHPDRFSHDPRLQRRANEQLKTINEAYKVLYKELSSTNIKYFGSGERGGTYTPPKKPRKKQNGYPAQPNEEAFRRDKGNPSAKARKSKANYEPGYEPSLGILLIVMMALLWLLVLRLIGRSF